jgi:hypothetical protein
MDPLALSFATSRILRFPALSKSAFSTFYFAHIKIYSGYVLSAMSIRCACILGWLPSMRFFNHPRARCAVFVGAEISSGISQDGTDVGVWEAGSRPADCFRFSDNSLPHHLGRNGGFLDGTLRSVSLK